MRDPNSRASLVARLIAAPSAGQKHSGPEQVELLSECLSQHPGRFSTAVLRARLAAVAADGAGSRGGEDSQHASTSAAELFWRHIHPHADRQLSPPTDWDMFHPSALEIFDIARVLGSLFGVGDGRVIYRATADQIGARPFRVPDQGGSRKVVALANTIEHLLKTMKTFHASLHARVGQTEGAQRRGAQSKIGLINVGRRISALNFITFTLTVGDVMQKRIVPVALRSQQVDVGSWEMDRECHEVLSQLSDDAIKLSQLRRWCFITSVLETYVREKDLYCLWLALAISPFGQVFGRLPSRLYDRLRKQKFQGCRLSVELLAEGAMGGVQFHVLSPRCQCFSQRTRSRGAHVGGEVCLVGGLAPVRVRGRLVMVPEWVAFTGYTKAQLTAHEHFPVPRFLRVERERATPMQLQGVSRFKQAGQVPRCVVPDQSKFAIRDVLEGLFEAECFLGRLADFVQAYAVGTVGVNTTMRTAYENAKICWDFRFLLRKAPVEKHYVAFFGVYDSVRPALASTLWPDDPIFAWVAQQWPAKRGPLGMFEQYRTLMQRIRAASKSRWMSRRWWRMNAIIVQPVHHYPSLRASLGQSHWLRAIPSHIRCCVLGLIGEIALGLPSVSTGKPFKTSISTLAALGCGKTLRQQERHVQRRFSEEEWQVLLLCLLPPLLARLCVSSGLKRCWMKARWLFHCWRTGTSPSPMLGEHIVGTPYGCIIARG